MNDYIIVLLAMLGVSGNAMKIGGKTSSSQAGNSSATQTAQVRGKAAPLGPVSQSSSVGGPKSCAKKSSTSRSSISKKSPVKTGGSQAKLLPDTLEDASVNTSLHLNVRESALLALAREPDPALSGTVGCRFNHYKKAFPVKNGVLQWKDVDEEYSFSFVYRGIYSRELELLEQAADCSCDTASDHKNKHYDKDASPPSPPLLAAYMPHCTSGEYFIGLVPGRHYMVRVEEGPEGVGAEGLRLREGPVQIGQARSHVAMGETCAGPGGVTAKGKMGLGVSGAGSKSGNSAVHEITKELLNMKVSDLHGDLARQLREARDIEDVLFSH